MKIYIDLLFIVNIIFDFILLLCVSLILRRNAKLYRIFLGSLVGGISIFFLFLNISSFSLFLYKIIIAIFMCIVTFSFRDIKYFISNFINLYLVSIVLGGMLYFLNIELSYKNNGIIFYHENISINLIFIVILCPILLFIYIKQIKSYKNNYSKYYKVIIYFKNGDNIQINGFLDTGNNLLDPYKNRPVILVSYNKVKSYILNEKELIVPYNDINGNGLLKCIKVKYVLVNNIKFTNILLGVLHNKIYIDGVDCILNNNMEGIC